MHKVSISPVTRANSVGSVTAWVVNGKIVEAYSESSIFRGFEIMLEGRDPLDAPYFTQRICGICSSMHGLASCLALENLARVEIPPNAIRLRNIIVGLDLLQNHLRHFYMLLLWDWVKPPPGPLFQGAYTRDFRLSEEDTAALHEHYWQGVDNARIAHEALTILGGKTPHNHGLVPGGVSFFPQGNQLQELHKKIETLARFIDNVYIPDVELLQRSYPEYESLGGRLESYLSFGLFPLADSEGFHMSPGVMLKGKRKQLDLTLISESIAFSYFRGQGGSPMEEKTLPDMSNPDAYSFVKSPRYLGEPCEGGPLARRVLNQMETGKNASLPRIFSRAKEARQAVQLIGQWIEHLKPGEAFYEPFQVPSGSGLGAVDAMRGPLAHWIAVKKGRIEHFQIITPSAWNFSPRDENGHRGPVEEALLDTPVEDISQPVEIGRVLRSFDPCYACSAHVIDKKENQTGTWTINV